MRGFLARYPQVDAERLLSESGLDPTVVHDREATYSVRSMLTFLERAAEETGDDCFGLELGAQVPLRDLDVLGYVLLHSPTLGAGFENACRYFAVQQTLGRLTMSLGTSFARLAYSMVVPEAVRTTQHFGVVLAILVKFAREATGVTDWSPREVHFIFEPPRDPSRFKRFFGAPVLFGQSENALIVPLEDLALPLKEADPGLLPILQRHANELLERIPRTGLFADSVRRQLAEQLGTGNVAIETVALRMNTTPRSIQRRLHEAGTSYQDLLAETRLALAQRFLRDRSLTLTDIAFLVGYSDLSAFSRAFRRWTGVSPLDYRRRNA